MSKGKVLTFVNRGVNVKLVRIAREQWDVLARNLRKRYFEAKFSRGLSIVEDS